MYTYKTIIFDLDGTLFKTDTVFVNALNEVRLTRGLTPLAEEKVMKLIGEPMTVIYKLIFGDSTTEDEIEQIRSEIRAMERKLTVKSGRLYDSVVEMLNKLKEDGYTLCICSNGSSQYVENVLQTFGLTDKFSIIKSRIDGLSKSQLIKQILDESSSTSSVVVGDRLIDFEASNDTGCLSIGALYGYGENECKKADFSAETPIEIYHIIKKINGLFNQVSQQIVRRSKKDRPFLVGINGVDTSGKTVFTQELGNYLKKLGFKVQIVHLDDFHNPSKIRLKEPDPVIL